MQAIRIHQAGGADQLRLEQIALPHPGAGEVRFRVEAIGVNFVDIYYRSGLYPATLPLTLGQEAAGTITAVGEGAEEFRVGDRVATARAVGAYAEEAVAGVAHLVRLPAGVSTELAAALLLQGVTAHFLTHDTAPLKAGDTILVHAAAGGVGLLLIQLAKKRGARVLACVGSEAKVAFAREAGADEVIVTAREDFAAAARRLTSGRGVDVAYDSVGKDTFEGTLNSLRARGLFVTYGNASGPVAPFSPLLLSQKGSLFFTRPIFAHYASTQELRARSDELFRWYREGTLRVKIGAKYPLAAAADAHRALEGRQTTGKVLLLP